MKKRSGAEFTQFNHWNSWSESKPSKLLPPLFSRWHLDEGRRWGFITTLGQVPCPVGLCWAQHRTPSLPCHWRSWHAASPVFWCLWWHVLLKSGVLPSLHWSAFLKSHEDSLLLWSLSALSCFALYLGIWKLLVAFFPVCWNIQESPAPFCKKKKKKKSQSHHQGVVKPEASRIW